MNNSMVAVDNKIVEKNENLTNSERFTNMVLKEFKGNIGELNLNEYQKQLVRNYFIGIDNALKMAETSRQFSKKKANEPPITWENVNMNALARDVVQNAKLGLDMSIKNHLHVVPYKNNKTNKYDLALMPGYEGLKYIASNYSLYRILDIRVELVRETDVFQPTYKNNVEGYEFRITNPFSRGNVIGGFGYIRYENEIHNQLVLMSVDELLKRKPSTASAEFWGGEKDKWEDGKRVGTEKVEGWTDEMLYKTMVRATCKKVPVDPKKINDSYIYVMEGKDDYYISIDEEKAKEEISQNANTEEIDFLPADVIEASQVNESQVPPAQPDNIEYPEVKKVERNF
ncbi:MAG: recombinase RecT [Clostridia bacterium]|nr:recombinase RecT [Clostridia bacterium]